MLLSSSLTDGQFAVETLNNIGGSDTANIHDYNYLVLPLDEFANKQSFLEMIYKNFNGIIIGLFSGSSAFIHKLISQYGEISYSLQLSEELFHLLQANELEGEPIYSPDAVHYSLSEESIDNALKNRRVRELVCSFFCTKNKKSSEKQEFVFDVVAVLAGFIPIFGSVVGVTFKYLYKFLCKYISEKIENQLKCSLCENM